MFLHRIRVIRSEWFPAVGFSLSALYIHEIVDLRNILLVIALGIGYAIAFGMNDYFDTSSDRLDERKRTRNFFVNYSGNLSSVKLLLLITLLPLVFIAYLFHIVGILYFLLSILISYTYSAPPLRLKSRPGLDVLIHAIFISSYPYYVVLLLNDVSFHLFDFLVIIFAVFFSLGSQLINQLRDYDTDILLEKNFTIYFGKNMARFVIILSSIICLSVASVSVIYNYYSQISNIVLILLTPLFLFRIFSPESDRLNSITKISAFLVVSLIFVYILT